MTVPVDKIPINTIICGDCLSVMADWPDNSIDTIITDPPYGLGFMGKEWDTFAPEYVEKMKRQSIKRPPRTNGRNVPIGGIARDAGTYDHSRNTEFQQWFTVWAVEVLRIAKPGAIMMIFGGTRTYHRLTCAVEDAGWLIRDCMMWLFGSGFPKSHNISKAIDKAKGAEPVIQTEKKEDMYGKYQQDKKLENPATAKKDTFNCSFEEGYETAPTTDLAKQWDGWGTALKPAYEPILVCMKPLDGTFAQNAEKWGVAGLNIDGGRIGTGNNLGRNPVVCNSTFHHPTTQKKGVGSHSDNWQKGRWPANVILDEEAAEMLDEQSGVLQSGAMKKPYEYTNTGFSLGKPAGETKQIHNSNSGGASRFFYCPKVSRAERNIGLANLPFERRADREKDDGIGGDNPRNRTNAPKQNHHPTVKPLKLMEYLCNLTKTPTGGTVLDPFAGSGTTGMACVNTGRDYVLIEKDPEYCKIAKRRIAAVTEQNKGQLALFGG